MKVQKYVAIAMAVVFPMSLIAAESHSAVVYAANSVAINGTAVNKSNAVFAGDKLQVMKDSSATITASGTSVLVPAGSMVTYNGDSVSLDQNAAVRVTTQSGMGVRASGISIAPSHNSAKFEVARYNGRVFIAARQGSVVIADASGSHALAEGGTTSVADPEPQKPGSVPATSGGSGIGEIPTWVAVLIGLAAAGAAAGIALATTGTPSSSVH